MKHDAETVQIAMQNAVQMFVQKNGSDANAFAERRADDYAEPYEENYTGAFCRTVIRADDLQKNDTDAETVCRNELQKPCRKNAPMQYCLPMQYVVQNYLQNPLQMLVQKSVQILRLVETK